MPQCKWCEDETANESGYCDDTCKDLDERTAQAKRRAKGPPGIQAKCRAGERELRSAWRKAEKRERLRNEE